MYLLDVITALFLPSGIGWIFLLAVIVIEGVVLSRSLFHRWFEPFAWMACLFSNVITAAIGFVLLADGHKGYVISWIPVAEYRGSLNPFPGLLILIEAFAISLVVEALFNKGLITNVTTLTGKEVWKATLRANLITYALAALIMVYFMLFDQQALR